MKTAAEWATTLLNTIFRKDFERIVGEIRHEAQLATIAEYQAMVVAKSIDDKFLEDIVNNGYCNINPNIPRPLP